MSLQISYTGRCASDRAFLRQIYKIPDGKPENQFAFSGEAKNKRYATEIIHECNEAWKKLIAGNGGHSEHGIAM
jgi:inorganic pyrophosphatase